MGGGGGGLILLFNTTVANYRTFDLKLTLINIHVQYSHLLAGATGGYTCHKWFGKYSHLLAGATGG